MYSQVQHRSFLDHPWRIAALVTIVANVTFNYANEYLFSDGRNVAAVSHAHPTLFTPADYGFAIWGAIYASTLLYAVWSLLPSQLDVPFHDRIAPWLMLENALASLWILLFSAEHLAPSAFVMVAMLSCSALMFNMASDHVKHEGLSRWWRVPFGLWLGWLSVATLANVSIAFSAAGWSAWPLSGSIWTALLLGVVAFLALMINMVYRDAVVPLVVSWAAAAIALAHWRESTLVGIVATLIAVKALFWGGAALLFEAFPMPRRYLRAAGRALRFDPRHPDGF